MPAIASAANVSVPTSVITYGVTPAAPIVYVPLLDTVPETVIVCPSKNPSEINVPVPPVRVIVSGLSSANVNVAAPDVMTGRLSPSVQTIKSFNVTLSTAND